MPELQAQNFEGHQTHGSSGRQPQQVRTSRPSTAEPLSTQEPSVASVPRPVAGSQDPLPATLTGWSPGWGRETQLLCTCCRGGDFAVLLRFPPVSPRWSLRGHRGPSPCSSFSRVYVSSSCRWAQCLYLPCVARGMRPRASHVRPAPPLPCFSGSASVSSRGGLAPAHPHAGAERPCRLWL